MLLTVILVLFALLLRLAIAPVEAGLQYLTFFPAVTIAAMVGGVRMGLLATLMGMVLATTIFVPPYYSLSLAVLRSSLWSNLVFAADGAVISILIETMHRHRERLASSLRVMRRARGRPPLRARARIDLQVAAAAFETNVGILVTDAGGVILRVNRAMELCTGYSASELVGQTPRILKSGHHDKDFYERMWASLREEGAWQGEIWDRRKSGEIYPKWMTITAVKGPNGEVGNYVSTQIDITERKVAEDEIRYLVDYDPLTQLPNRRLLLERLRLALASSGRRARYAGLLLVDLDHFKHLNDTLGHYIGDLLLEQVAARLARLVRRSDTVARVGGDEFVIMVEDLHEQATDAAAFAMVLAEKVLAELRQPYWLDGQRYLSTASIGMTLFIGTGDTTVHDPLKQADLALHKAKASGRNAVRFFDPQMQSAVIARLALETDLRVAVAEGQFELHYQPQISGASGLTGAEALLRWRHPQRGMLEPGSFIEVAEEVGIMPQLGRWVVETACAQLVSWRSDESLAHLTLSVNVGPREFRESGFVEHVIGVLDRTGAPAGLLKLEITEGAFLENYEDTVAKMRTLKAQGVEFALDDFGTGYSSLSYLKRLPLDELKIDRSFVRDVLDDPSDAAIATTIVSLAGSLGLSVIAEGVETPAQQEFLARHGCDCFQGYLFSRPLPLDDFKRFSRRSRLPAQGAGAQRGAPSIPLYQADAGNRNGLPIPPVSCWMTASACRFSATCRSRAGDASDWPLSEWNEETPSGS